MSRNKYSNYINQNNKILFETRLQIKNNSVLKINKFPINHKAHRNNNILFVNTTRPFVNDVICKKRKNQSILEYSSLNNDQKTISINIKKRNKKNNYNGNNSYNKTNVLNFFNLKKPAINDDKQNRTFINANKKILYYNNSNNKNINLNSKNKEEKDKRMVFNLKKSKKFKNLNKKELNSMIKSMNIINDDYKLNNSKNDYDIINKAIIKERIDSRNNKKKFYKNDKKNNSFLDDVIKKIKNQNLIYLKKNNNPVLAISSTQRGRNISTNKDSDEQNKYTYRNIYSKNTFGKSYKSSFAEINYYKNNKSLKKQKLKNKIINEKKDKKNNLNKITINKIGSKRNSRNYKRGINKKYTYNELKWYKDSNEEKLITFDNIKNDSNNNTYQEFQPIKKNQDKNDQENKKKLKKNKKSLEIIEDNNGSSTKTNDDNFNEETPKEENSGILSMNEIEDIIKYNNMSDINKNKDYLFYNNDHINFVKKYKSILYKNFFNNPNPSYKLSLIKIKKKIIMKDSENIIHSNRIKVHTCNNSVKKKK